MSRLLSSSVCWSPRLPCLLVRTLWCSFPVLLYLASLLTPFPSFPFHLYFKMLFLFQSRLLVCFVLPLFFLSPSSLLLLVLTILTETFFLIILGIIGVGFFCVAVWFCSGPFIYLSVIDTLFLLMIFIYKAFFIFNFNI